MNIGNVNKLTGHPVEWNKRVNFEKIDYFEFVEYKFWGLHTVLLIYSVNLSNNHAGKYNRQKKSNDGYNFSFNFARK